MRDNYEKRIEVFKPPLVKGIHKISGKHLNRRGGFSSKTLNEEDELDIISDNDPHSTPVRTKPHRSMTTMEKEHYEEMKDGATFSNIVERRGTDLVNAKIGPNRKSILLGR